MPVIVDADGYNAFDLVSASEAAHQSEVRSFKHHRNLFSYQIT